MVQKKTHFDLIEMKKKGEQVAWVTAYNFPMASLMEKAGMDMILVGDSLGMVVLGYQDTSPVTMEDSISHCQAVRRGAPNTFCIGDMPFLSYQISIEESVRNAGRFVREARMDAVKMEGGIKICDYISAITDAGIMVMGHVGSIPLGVNQVNNFETQGREPQNAREIIQDALAIQESGAYAILLEGTPPELTSFLHKRLSIPVYSVGAGGPCDGQLMMWADMLGISQNTPPKFVKKYANIAEIEINAYKEYINDVKIGAYPSEEYNYQILNGKEKEFSELLKEFE